MSQTLATVETDVCPSLERLADPETLRIIAEEGLLPAGLVNRLHTLYPQHSALKSTAEPLFSGKEKYAGMSGFREVCGILKAHGVDIGHEEERELFIDVYRFMATRHTLDSIDWQHFTTDPMFHLVFPQPGMIRREVVEAYRRAGTREEKERIAAEYMRETNPHDGKQLPRPRRFVWNLKTPGRV